MQRLSPIKLQFNRFIIKLHTSRLMKRCEMLLYHCFSFMYLDRSNKWRYNSSMAVPWFTRSRVFLVMIIHPSFVFFSLISLICKKEGCYYSTCGGMWLVSNMTDVKDYLYLNSLVESTRSSYLLLNIVKVPIIIGWGFTR